MACYDELLEQTLREAGYRVVRDMQVPYSEQGDRDMTLVKLFGCVSAPESLVLTERDQVRLINRLGRNSPLSFRLRPFVHCCLSDMI